MFWEQVLPLCSKRERIAPLFLENPAQVKQPAALLPPSSEGSSRTWPSGCRTPSASLTGEACVPRREGSDQDE